MSMFTSVFVYFECVPLKSDQFIGKLEILNELLVSGDGSGSHVGSSSSGDGKYIF